VEVRLNHRAHSRLHTSVTEPRTVNRDYRSTFLGQAVTIARFGTSNSKNPEGYLHITWESLKL